MSFFSGSVDKRLTNVDDFLPRKKRRNGKNGRNGSAKRAAQGFESPGFFGGLEAVRNGGGIPKIDRDRDIGVAVPELGEGFNSRIGNIGTGFTESVNPFKIGFTDILTGNGRTGEIIGGGSGAVTSAFGKRKRGRPKGSGKKQQKAALGEGIVPKKPVSISTKGAKKLKAEAIKLTKAGDLEGAKAKLAQIKSESVGGLLKKDIKSKASGLKERIRRGREPLASAIVFQEQEFDREEVGEEGPLGPVAERAPGERGTRRAELDLEGRVDEEQVERFRQEIAVERAGEEAVEEAIDDEPEPEDEGTGLDEDMDEVSNGEEGPIGDDFAGGEIRRGS